MIYNDKNSSFLELLEKDKTLTIHHRNIHTLAIELYKIKNNMAPPIRNTIFLMRENNHNLRSESCFKGGNVKTIQYGTSSLVYLAPKIWNLIPKEIKNYNSLIIFKKKINQWTPSSCPWRLCKKYVQEIGFLFHDCTN